MNSRLFAAAAALLLSACSSSPTIAEPEPLKKIAAPEVVGKLIWSEGLPAPGKRPGLEPLLVADRIFVGARNGKVTALDVNGEELWQVATGLRLSAGPGLVDGKLVFGTLDAEVIALNATDGTTAWTATVSSEVVGAPAGDQSIAVIRSGDGRVFGLDAANGERLWAADRSVPALTLRGNGRMIAGGGMVFLGLDNGRLLALSLKDGATAWEEVISVPSGRSEIERLVDVDAHLLIADGVLYAVSYGGDVVALRAATGAELWRQPMRSSTGFALDRRCLYVTDADAVLWCLEPSSGSTIWSQSQLKHRGLSAPAAYKGNVVVGDFEGFLHWVSPVNGKIVGRMRVADRQILVPPTVYRDGLYVMAINGDLARVDVRPVSGD